MLTHRSVLIFNSAENLWEPRAHNPRSPLHGRPQDLLACALIALLLCSILAFGAVYPPGILTLQLGAAALFFATLATQLNLGKLNFEAKPALLPLLVLGAIVLCQLLFHRTAYWYATYEEALLWTAYLLVFLTASALFRTPRAARIALLTLAVFGPLVALFAIIQSFNSNGLIYWFHAPYETSRVIFGPYVNRNHYAGMIELLAPFPLVLAFHPHYPRPQRALALFAAALMYASVVAAASRGGAIACLFQILFFTIIAGFSQPRAPHKGVIPRNGVIPSERRESRDLGVDLRASNANPRALASAALLLLAVLALALWIEPTHMLERLSSLHLHDEVAGRPTMFHDALLMLRVHPLTGFGLHTFPTVYPAYRSFSTELFVNELHNDFLQTFVELGFLGGIALLAFVYLTIRDSLRLLFTASPTARPSARSSRSQDGVIPSERSESRDPGVGSGVALPRAQTNRVIPSERNASKDLGFALGDPRDNPLALLRLASLIGVAGLLLHSFGDFNLHIPANAACFFALCAFSTNTAAPPNSPSTARHQR